MTAGQTIKVRFDRKPTAHCADPLSKYPGTEYSVWLYNNPVRDRDNIHFDQSIKITSGFKEKAGAVDVTIPKNLPEVENGSLWYLRVQASLSTAPQVCFDSLVLLARGVISITAGYRYFLGGCRC